MARVSVTLDEEADERLDELAESDEFDSRSEAVRRLIKERAELEGRIDELETDVERLKNEKRVIINERREKKELMEYVEEERATRERQREIESAPVWRRFRYWITGTPDADAES